ncbi:hypothetical protein [Nitrosopumilus sp.]|uniref:hypothetical protein n=1 Tax=Nitrosopumilus sp. TaxID=2024843 RepID=UPI00292F30AB|nr:hypothetical protein [Nitrosopumilus sp.]
MAKFRGDSNSYRTDAEKPVQPKFKEFSKKPKQEFTKPPTKNMLVLGELNRGTKTFANIQKNTSLTNNELDGILENLEKNGFLKVHHKQGMFGTKIELYPTDKGMKEYYS